MMNEVLPCPCCSANMFLVACSSSKSPDLLIWCCSSCRKYKNVRAEIALGDTCEDRNVNWLLPADTVWRLQYAETVYSLWRVSVLYRKFPYFADTIRGQCRASWIVPMLLAILGRQRGYWGALWGSWTTSQFWLWSILWPTSYLNSSWTPTLMIRKITNISYE